MVLLSSKPVDTAFTCPDFSLPAVTGEQVSLGDFEQSQALLVAFICGHCPYVVAIEDRLLKLKEGLSDREFAMVGICANDPKDYPDDSPENLLKRVRHKGYNFAYLIDETQAVAKAFDAVCTPDLFLFDAQRRLYYHGRLDDSWSDAAQVKEASLKQAIQGIISGTKPPKNQQPSMGCSIKWKR